MSYPRARRATRGGNSLVTAPVIQLPPPPIPHARGRSVGSQIQNRPSAPTAPFRRRYPVVSSTGRRPTARRPKLLHVPGAGTTPKAGALRGAASHSGPPGRAPSRRWSREGSCTRATTRANGGPTSNPSKSSEFAPADYLAARGTFSARRWRAWRGSVRTCDPAAAAHARELWSHSGGCLPLLRLRVIELVVPIEQGKAHLRHVRAAWARMPGHTARRNPVE
eukprot:scaffold197248_cov30-Tisochrysis_lutea.AAC.4